MQKCKKSSRKRREKNSLAVGKDLTVQGGARVDSLPTACFVRLDLLIDQWSKQGQSSGNVAGILTTIRFHEVSQVASKLGLSMSTKNNKHHKDLRE
jgi:hypothetical protein